MRKMMENRKGFTLIEVMVVVALIGIVMALVISNVQGRPEAKFNNVLREITQNIVLAKFCAISKNTNYVVAFDVQNNQYFVLEDTNNNFDINTFSPPPPPCPYYPGVCNFPSGGAGLIGDDSLVICKRIDSGVVGGVNVTGTGIGFIAGASIGVTPPFPFQNIDVSSVCPACVNNKLAFIFTPDGRAFVNSASMVGNVRNGGAAILVSMNAPGALGMITKSVMVRTPRGEVKIFPR